MANGRVTSAKARAAALERRWHAFFASTDGGGATAMRRDFQPGTEHAAGLSSTSPQWQYPVLLVDAASEGGHQVCSLSTLGALSGVS